MYIQIYYELLSIILRVPNFPESNQFNMVTTGFDGNFAVVK